MKGSSYREGPGLLLHFSLYGSGDVFYSQWPPATRCPGQRQPPGIRVLCIPRPFPSVRPRRACDLAFSVWLGWGFCCSFLCACRPFRSFWEMSRTLCPRLFITRSRHAVCHELRSISSQLSPTGLPWALCGGVGCTHVNVTIAVPMGEIERMIIWSNDQAYNLV